MDLTTLATNPERAMVALAVAAIVALAAMRIGALTSDGAVAAATVGTLLVGAAGWWVGATLVMFFVTSTVVSKIGMRRSSAVRQAKGSRRDATQVLANGGVPVLFAALGWSSGHSAWILGAVVAIAAAAADTWATEIGRLTQATPFGVTLLRRVPVGTSGAISVPGTGASMFAGMVFGAVGAIGVGSGWLSAPVSAPVTLVVVAVFATAGSVVDSLLGATVQERRRCSRCGEHTEQRRHTCGGATIVAGGIPGFDNDVVNVVSITFAALAAVSLGYGFG